MSGHVRTRPDTSGQEKREMEKGEKQKTTVIHRIRKRVHTTVSPETYEYLKETALNVGKLLDNAVSELRKITSHSLVIISQKKEELWARGDSNARPPPCEGDVITS